MADSIQTVKRPRDIKITNRPCVVCKSNCQVAFVLRVRGALSVDIHFCKTHMRQALAELDAGRDFICLLNFVKQEGGLIHVP